jgi:hypothetical protein
MLRITNGRKNLQPDKNSPKLNAAIVFSTAHLFVGCRGTAHGTVLVWIAGYKPGCVKPSEFWCQYSLFSICFEQNSPQIQFFIVSVSGLFTLLAKWSSRLIQLHRYIPFVVEVDQQFILLDQVSKSYNPFLVSVQSIFRRFQIQDPRLWTKTQQAKP